MDYTMSAVIATRKLTRTTQDGDNSLVEVRIGTPMHRRFEDGSSDWYCPVQILGIEDDTVNAVFGGDSIQALYLALYMAGVFIATSSAAMEIEGHEDNFGFPATAA